MVPRIRPPGAVWLGLICLMAIPLPIVRAQDRVPRDRARQTPLGTLVLPDERQLNVQLDLIGSGDEPRLGLVLAEVDKTLRAQLDLPEEGGLVVVRVKSGG